MAGHPTVAPLTGAPPGLRRAAPQPLDAIVELPDYSVRDRDLERILASLDFSKAYTDRVVFKTG